MDHMVWLTDEQIDFLRLAMHQFTVPLDGDERKAYEGMRGDVSSAFHNADYDLTREPITPHANERTGDWERYLNSRDNWTALRGEGDTIFRSKK